MATTAQIRTTLADLEALVASIKETGLDANQIINVALDFSNYLPRITVQDQQDTVLAEMETLGGEMV